jgi:RecJ-like exonuclease
MLGPLGKCKSCGGTGKVTEYLETADVYDRNGKYVPVNLSNSDKNLHKKDLRDGKGGIFVRGRGAWVARHKTCTSCGGSGKR